MTPPTLGLLNDNPTESLYNQYIDSKKQFIFFQHTLLEIVMGQAKLRAKEIAELKAKPAKEFGILAIRHCQDGSTEFAHFAATYEKPTLNKQDLLRYICMKDWLHTPPAGAIAHYLWQTNTFAMMEKFNGAEAFIINFYEFDEEISARKGDKVFSCRKIMASNREGVQAYADQLGKEFAANPEYSVKFNHTI